MLVSSAERGALSMQARGARAVCVGGAERAEKGGDKAGKRPRMRSARVGELQRVRGPERAGR